MLERITKPLLQVSPLTAAAAVSDRTSAEMKAMWDESERRMILSESQNMMEARRLVCDWICVVMLHVFELNFSRAGFRVQLRVHHPGNPVEYWNYNPLITFPEGDVCVFLIEPLATVKSIKSSHPPDIISFHLGIMCSSIRKRHNKNKCCCAAKGLQIHAEIWRVLFHREN